MTTREEAEEISADPLTEIAEAIIEAAKEECMQHSQVQQVSTDGVTGEVRCYYAGLTPYLMFDCLLAAFPKVRVE